MSGLIIAALDQVLVGRLSLVASALAMVLAKRYKIYGPFLSDLGTLLPLNLT